MRSPTRCVFDTLESRTLMSGSHDHDHHPFIPPLPTNATALDIANYNAVIADQGIVQTDQATVQTDQAALNTAIQAAETTTPVMNAQAVLTAESEQAQLRSLLQSGAAAAAISALHSATDSILAMWSGHTPEAQAVSVPYLMLCGFALGGWLTSRAASRAAQGLSAADPEALFLRAKLQTARFYADATLPHALALAQLVRTAAASIVQAEPELL